MSNKDSFFKIWLLLFFIGSILVIIWFINIVPSPKEEINMALGAYFVEQYSGTIVDKYIDSEEHNFKKIVIIEKNKERIILFDIETGGTFNFLSIGDSISKTNRTFQIHVIRNKLDTVINMRFNRMSEFDYGNQ